MERVTKIVATLIATIPNPVPEGQSKENFFNENYKELVPTPAYRWFQHSMVLKVQAEEPGPSLQQTLQHPTYP